jgi:NAD(P)-dependent dehydrogenase (short-subunit alcohol dehydrogenase family)
MATIVVTGSSSGFGRLFVESLLKDGHKVIATMRNMETKNKTQAMELKKLGATTVEMDVTSDTSVNMAVESMIRTSGAIDVVINNAGLGVLGFQESFTTDDWKKLFEVNVFGVQRVNRAVLPLMREKKSGLLIHISSILGRMVIPFYGPYNASKFALEAMADNYRIELSSFGIESIIVEPGGYGTAFSDNLMIASDKARTASYGTMAQVPEESLKGFKKHLEGTNAPNPKWVADAVVNLIKMPRGQRPFRTTVDKLGMGAAIEPYNKSIEEIQRNVYTAFGMADVLKLKM